MLFEILLEIIVQILGELFFEAALAALARGFAALWERLFGREPRGQALLGYCLLAGTGGALSAAFLPRFLLRTPSLRIINLIVTPLLFGWGVRRRPGRTLSTFARGFLFALCFTGVRFAVIASLHPTVGRLTLPVPDELKACATSEDCREIENGCDHCCEYDAIAKRFEKVFLARFERFCAGYRSGICDCRTVAHHIECRESMCVTVLDRVPSAPAK